MADMEINEYLTKVKDFSEPQEAAAFISELKANGGGDFAEAVIDGLHDSVHNVKWRNDS